MLLVNRSDPNWSHIIRFSFLLMPIFILLHHFVDIVDQNNDQKLLKKMFKFNKLNEYRKKKFFKRIFSNFGTE